MRPIDAEAFIENLERFLPGIHQTYLAAAVMRIVKEVIDKQPTIEAKPVVSARWKLDSVIDSPYCSNCGKEALRDYFEDEVRSNYCPHCGAQMDEPFPQAHENGMKGE